MPPDVDAMADMVVLAIKAALAPVQARLQAVEATLATPVLSKSEAEIRGLLADLQTKAAQPGPPGARGEAGPVGAQGERGEPGLPGLAGVKGADGLIGDRGVEGPAGRDGRDGLPGVPGLPGDKGLDGTNGQHGIHGKDGLGFEDFEEVFDGERTYIRRYKRGETVKEFTFTVPYVLDRGVYQAGHHYEKGDGVTWGGSFWIAQDDTQAKPGEAGAESRAWRLAVKAGRDGKPAPVRLDGGR